MKTSELKVCLFPMQIDWCDKEENLKRLTEGIKHMRTDTDLLILPETFSTGFPLTDNKDEVAEYSEPSDGPTISLLKRLASDNSVAIAGTFIAGEGNALYNRAFFIEPSGETIFADKHHLFRMAGESKVFSRGYDRLIVNFKGWNIAMVVCYDIRFPVWCRNVENEYDILIVTANWPKVRINAWNALLPARALENLSYVCAVNCKGTDTKDYEYDGSSGVIDFKGKDISETTEEGMIYATLSLERIEQFRAKFPAWQDADPFKLL